jgi:DNA-binding NarL/FixJ family response regulator
VPHLPEPPAILIAHKDPLARAYLRGVIARAQRSCVCLEATSFNDTVDALAQHPSTGVALIDIDLPGMASDLGLRFFITHYPPTRIVALYSALAQDRIDRLEEAGVAGCVPKDLAENALIDALTTILRGDRFHAPGRSVPTAPAAPPQPAHGHGDHELTERQSEVLRLLALGRSNREIGHLLNIAEGTVKVHVNAAFRVLGVHNRVSAAAAIRKRLDEHWLEQRSRVEG